jgi:hypothetical protein
MGADDCGRFNGIDVYPELVLEVMLPGVEQGESRVRLEIGLSSRLARGLRRREW